MRRALVKRSTNTCYARVRESKTISSRQSACRKIKTEGTRLPCRRVEWLYANGLYKTVSSVFRVHFECIVKAYIEQPRANRDCALYLLDIIIFYIVRILYSHWIAFENKILILFLQYSIYTFYLGKRDFICYSNLRKISKASFNKDKRDDVSDFNVRNYVVYYLTRALTEKCFCGIFYYNCMTK